MLRLEKISKDLGEFKLTDVSLDIGQGEYMVILGPTGAGKTIILETVAGIYPPDSGRIELNGEDITFADPKDRNISMVYQDFMLFPHLSVFDNIAFGLSVKKVQRDEAERRVNEVAEIMGISHLLQRSVTNLSGGEKQRTAISRAIVMEPDVLLLDEPLSALDGKTRERLRKELKRLHMRYKTTVLHVTHNFEEVFSLADRVAVINEGRIIQAGEPDQVFSKPESHFIAEFVGTTNIFRGSITSGSGCSVITVGGLKIVSNVTGLEGEVYASVRPEDIMISREPLRTPARNSFEGNVESITNNGTMVEVRIDAGIPFVTVLTRRGFHDIGIKEGDVVFLTFKAAAVHVFS